MLLQKNNVLIRLFCEGDIENKIKWINDAENNQFLHYDIPLSYEKTLRWYRGKDKNTRLDCVIEYDGVPVGLIGLLGIDKVNEKAEFYISMGEPRFKRKGIATTATEIILEYAFKELALNKVYLNVDSENIAACRLYEKVGFVCEGEFKEDMLFKGKLIDRKRYAVLKKSSFVEV